MGSFSWNRADEVKEGEAENVYAGMRFKMLIPKEFGGGFILDKYRDYGVICDGRKSYDMNELLAFWNSERVVPEAVTFTCIYKKFEVGEQVTISKEVDFRKFKPEVVELAGKTFTIERVLTSAKMGSGGKLFLLEGVGSFIFEQYDFEQETKYIYEPVAGLLYDGEVMPKLPQKSKYTKHNRCLGIHISYPNKQTYSQDEYKAHVDTLRFPLKLVSKDYEGTYEDCVGRSYSDPDQGFFARIKRG